MSQKVSPLAPATSSAIADLKSRWTNLHDLDRARAVRGIVNSGVSIRQIAFQLEGSESSLRRLLIASKAPLEDQLLASNGKISTNELVRRAKLAQASRAATKREAQERKREKAALAGCKAICNWLRSENITRQYGAQIVGGARRELISAEEDDRLPRFVAPPGMSMAEIVKRCRPAGPSNDQIDLNHWFAQWLARWIFFAIPDSWVRYKTVELAFEELQRGSMASAPVGF